MPAASDRLEFAPPATPGLLRALALAVVAHAGLLAALTWGIHWNRETQVASFEAELWAALPVEAAPAPAPVELPPPEPEPSPAKPVAAEPSPEPEPAKPDINLQQEKQRLQKLEDARQEKARQEKLKLEKAREERQRQQEQKQLELKKKEAQEKKDAEKYARLLEAQRAQNLARISGMAGATGSTNATGTALQAAGPSASYAGRIRARIKPNIVFTDDIAGNPVAEVEVRTSPDGTIVGRKLLKSSGVASWDQAVLKAIDKTEVLPRDIDGRVPALLEISFKPKD